MGKIILFVANRANRKLLEQELCNLTHTVVEGESDWDPEEARLIIVDRIGLERNGKRIHQHKRPDGFGHLPILLLVPHDEIRQTTRRFGDQVDDFLPVPSTREEVAKRIDNLLTIRALWKSQAEYVRLIEGYNSTLEHRVAGGSGDLKEAYIQTVITLSRAAEFKDKQTGAHLNRVSYYCHRLAAEVGLNSDFQDQVFYASPMHDIGKIGISDEILLKKGPLTSTEWEIMRTHPLIGAKILQGASSPYLVMAREIALAHHEQWDGGGYPYGMAGHKIPISARVMSIADVYDALRSPRPYKEGFDHASALAIIRDGDQRTRPEHFDPELLAAFSRCHEAFREIFEEHQ